MSDVEFTKEDQERATEGLRRLAESAGEASASDNLMLAVLLKRGVEDMAVCIPHLLRGGVEAKTARFTVATILTTLVLHVKSEAAAISLIKNPAEMERFVAELDEQAKAEKLAQAHPEKL